MWVTVSGILIQDKRLWMGFRLQSCTFLGVNFMKHKETYFWVGMHRRGLLQYILLYYCYSMGTSVWTPPPAFVLNWKYRKISQERINEVRGQCGQRVLESGCKFLVKCICSTEDHMGALWAGNADRMHMSDPWNMPQAAASYDPKYVIEATQRLFNDSILSSSFFTVKFPGPMQMLALSPRTGREHKAHWGRLFVLFCHMSSFLCHIEKGLVSLTVGTICMPSMELSNERGKGIVSPS